MNRMSRRRFMKALTAGGVAYAFGRSPGTVWAQSAGVNGFADYKALVCVYLYGGNDSWSVLVPNSAAEYAAYARSRQNLAIAQDRLLPVQPVGSPDANYGFHPSMPGVQALFESSRCAVLANVGPLIEPVTKDQYRERTALLPPQLFSHNDQQTQWHTLRGRAPAQPGWAGRVADLLAAQLPEQRLALNVSLAGNTIFQGGLQATPYVMGPSGTKTFSGFGNSGTTLARRVAVENIARLEQPTIYGRAYAEVQQRAVEYAKLVNSALAAAPPMSASFPKTGLGTQLRTVARMIATRDRLAMSRQIFYVAIGGFDTHDDQLAEQPDLLGDLSASLAAFHAATVELGVASNVTTFTQSDFGRTLTSNGDGSDHAWGGVQLVIGDAVRGRTIYGNYPSLEIGGPEDVGGGRFIPSLSSDQYSATLARWFGIEDAQLDGIAPNLGNFAQRDLGFLI